MASILNRKTLDKASVPVIAMTGRASPMTVNDNLAVLNGSGDAPIWLLLLLLYP
jgi:hypothetical protein